MEELRIARIHAVADLGATFLEIRGEVVIGQARRLSDYLNHPDPMLELDAGELRSHGEEFWERVEGLSLNRNRVVVVFPEEEAEAEPETGESGDCRPVRVKVICRGVTIVGFMTVPLNATISGFIHGTRSRFLGVKEARVIPTPGGFQPENPGIQPFVMVNRSYIVAGVDTRPELRQTNSLVPETE